MVTVLQNNIQYYIENITILTAIITGTSNLIETNVIIPPYIDYQGT